MKLIKRVITYGVVILGVLAILSCGMANRTSEQIQTTPADKFDLTQWKISIPTDSNNDGKADQIDVKELQTYQHPDFFYLDSEDNMVFSTPNKAMTSPNSTNTRSELRHMIGGKDTDPKALSNNFSIKANTRASEFAQVGGNLQATLKVNHVSKRAKYSEKPSAFSVVVGQIHALKDKELRQEGGGYGWGNEPLKIYYKKWPNHEYGSVFWNYERNLEKDNPDRVDISYSVWGKSWLDSSAPEEQGIALDETFSYEVNVYENIMYLTFSSTRLGTVNYEINLANNRDAYGKIDQLDHPYGYSGEANFFKAGAYNQCSIKDHPSFRYPACLGTGNWLTDKVNGDYTQVTFMQLKTSKGIKPI